MKPLRPCVLALAALAAPLSCAPTRSAADSAPSSETDGTARDAALDATTTPDAPDALDALEAPDAPDAPDALDALASPDALVADARDTALDAPRAYPPGPYGTRVGDVLADLAWEGYVNPSGAALSTASPYVDTSLGALRGAGRGYALVHVAEFL